MLINPRKDALIYPIINPYGRELSIPRGTICYHDFAERGNKLLDKSGKNNHGTNSGSTVKVINNILVRSFDGSTSYVEMADDFSLRMTRGGTIMAWIYPKSLGEGDNGRIIDKSINDGAGDGYLLVITATNRLVFRVNGGTILTSTENSVMLNTWQCVVVTFDGSGRAIYINSVDATNTGGTETALPPNIAGVVRIGNYSQLTTRTFDGYINDVQMFEKVLTQAQILAIYRNTRHLYKV